MNDDWIDVTSWNDTTKKFIRVSPSTVGSSTATAPSPWTYTTLSVPAPWPFGTILRRRNRTDDNRVMVLKSDGHYMDVLVLASSTTRRVGGVFRNYICDRWEQDD